MGWFGRVVNVVIAVILERDRCKFSLGCIMTIKLISFTNGLDVVGM